MVDRLATLLGHFAVSARTFQAGALCGINSLEGKDPYGQLHLIRDGAVEVRHGKGVALHITQPSLLLYPRPMAHRFITDRKRGADFVCAHLSFEGGTANPIAAALPPFVCLPLSQLQGSDAVLKLLFDEAAAQNCGRQAMLDCLFEVVLIQILRQLMEQGQTEAGMLVGLAHPQLRRALVAMHEQPQKDWTLDELASVSGMSRSAFANSFRKAVGVTPGSYLQRWRIGLAQKALLQERSLKLIAQEVGYGSEAALSRAFKAQIGQSPREWRNAQPA
jgi:AraC-like DNA-binding protein